MKDIVEAYTVHALTTEYEHLPESAVESVKRFLLDTIGVGIAGANNSLTLQIRRSASKWSRIGDANVWGQGNLKVNALTAAFLNGFQIHCQEYDCVHEPAVVHPMATILSALMADVDQLPYPISGCELAVAVVVAVDLAAGIGVCVESPLKFFRPANAGLFGAVLGISRLRKFNKAQVRNALGYALSFNAGTMQAHIEGKPALPIQIANASRNAITACDLAEGGLEGPQDSLEGKFGYFALFEDKANLSVMLDNLGVIWRITEASHKPFPTGRAAHGGIVLMQELREMKLERNDIEKITLFAPPLIQRLVGRPIKKDMSASYARLCFQYTGTLAFFNGTVGLSDFEDEKLRNSEILKFGKKIDVVCDGTKNHSTFTPQKTIVSLKNGRKIEVRIKNLYGSPNNPMSKEDQFKKFRKCVDFGFGRPSEKTANKIIEVVGKLDEIKNVKILSQLANGLEA